MDKETYDASWDWYNTEQSKPICKRCNDNGCPACDGTKGSEYNPEPY